MKKITAVILIFTLLLALSGCGESGKISDSLSAVPKPDSSQSGVSKTKPPSTDKVQDTASDSAAVPPESDIPLSSALEGVFIRRVEDETELDMSELLEIHIFGGMVLMEHSLVLGENRELYDTWAEEFWPDFPGLLNDGSTSVDGKSQCYSFMAMAGNFQDLPQFRTLSLNGETLSIADAYGNATVYTSCTEGGIHSEPSEIMQNMGISAGTVPTTDPVGLWLCQSEDTTAYLDIGMDSSFVYAAKQPGKPSCVLKGCWTYESNGPLVIFAERTGYGGMPQMLSLDWSMDAGGNLYLQGLPSDDMSSMDGEIIFMPLDSNWSINPWNHIPFGYAVDFYSTEGSFTDDWGQEFSYSYRIPWVLGDSPDIQALNQRLDRDYVQPCEEALAAINSGEQTGLLFMDWDSSVYENLLFVTVEAQRFDGFMDYESFCYDLQEDRLIDTPEILRQLGISESSFTDAVRSRADEFYMQNAEEMPECVRNSEDFTRQYEWTVSSENINTGLMVYVDRMGELVSITPVGSLAGADWYYHLLNTGLRP